DHRDEGVAGLEPAELGVPSGYSWKTARRVVPGLADVRTRHAGVSLVASHVSVLVRTDHPQTVGRSEFHAPLLELRAADRADAPRAVPDVWHGTVRSRRQSRRRLEQRDRLPPGVGGLDG